jgi:hypothetical protein
MMATTKAPPELGKVELRRSDLDNYEVGAEVEGHWVSFASIAGEQVRANVSNAQAAAEAAAEQS